MKTTKTKTQTAIEYIYAHPGCRTDALATLLDIDPKNVPAYLKEPLAYGLIISCKVQRPGQRICQEYKPSTAAPDKCPADWLEWKRDRVEARVKPLKFNAEGPRGLAKKTSVVSETPAGGGVNITGSDASDNPVGEFSPPSEGATVVETQAASNVADDAGVGAPHRPAVSDEKNDIDKAIDHAITALWSWQEAAMAGGFSTPEALKQHFTDPANATAAPFGEPAVGLAFDNEIYASLNIGGAMFIGYKDQHINLPPEAVRQLHNFLEDTHPAFN